MTDVTPAAPPRPPVVTAIAGVWGVLMVVGVVQGVLELLDLLDVIRGMLGDGPVGANFGASIGAGLSGWAVWRGLLKGKPAAWKTIRRISWIAGPAFALATVILIVADPSSVTLSGPGGEIALQPEQRSIAIALGALGSVAFTAQALLLGRTEVRAFFTEPADPPTLPAPSP